MTEIARQLAIGEVAGRAGMSASQIRYYERRGLLAEPERVAGKRRYTKDIFRRLAIIDAAQRVGFTLEEIRDLLGSREQPAHERLRQLAVLKVPQGWRIGSFVCRTGYLLATRLGPVELHRL